MEAVAWRKVGPVDTVPRLGARRLCIKVDGAPIAVFRTRDDRVFALIDVCPHRAGPLSEGIISGATVTCPLHNWTIRLDDGGAIAPDEGATRTLPVRLANGMIYIGVPAMTAVEAG